MMRGYWVLYHTTFTAVQIVNQLLYMFPLWTLQVCQVYSDERAWGIHLTLCQLFICQFCGFPVPRWWNHVYVYIRAILIAFIWWHSCGDWDHTFPVFTLPLLCIIVNANNRNREDVEKSLEICSLAWLVILDSKICSSLIARFHHLVPFCSCLFLYIFSAVRREM